MREREIVRERLSYKDELKHFKRESTLILALCSMAAQLNPCSRRTISKLYFLNEFYCVGKWGLIIMFICYMRSLGLKNCLCSVVCFIFWFRKSFKIKGNWIHQIAPVQNLGGGGLWALTTIIGITNQPFITILHTPTIHISNGESPFINHLFLFIFWP